MKVTAVAAGLAFPYAAQAIQIVRRLRISGTKRWSRETRQRDRLADRHPRRGLAGLAAIIRGHWHIEYPPALGPRPGLGRRPLPGPHRQRPPCHGTLRNLAITILRLAGHASIAAALRRRARRPDQPLQTIMNC